MPSPTQLRSDVALLADEARDDLAALWREVDSALAAEAVLRDVLPALIESYGLAAATVAADWYDETREEVAARGRFGAEPAEIPDVGAQPLVGWALATSATYEGFQGLILGGTQRRIADFSRKTVMRSSIADPGADGWQRVTDGNACGFCQMLADRGAVYRETTADFASHDKCGCSATPVWTDEPKPVKPYASSRRNITAADRARTRKWMRANGYL